MTQTKDEFIRTEQDMTPDKRFTELKHPTMDQFISVINGKQEEIEELKAEIRDLERDNKELLTGLRSTTNQLRKAGLIPEESVQRIMWDNGMEMP